MILYVSKEGVITYSVFFMFVVGFGFILTIVHPYKLVIIYPFKQALEPQNASACPKSDPDMPYTMYRAEALDPKPKTLNP